MNEVGIRELRQHLSAALERVAAGETLVVTDRGRPVAHLNPLPERRSPYDRLVDEGVVLPPRSPRDGLPPPVALPPGAPTAGDVLADQRAERR